MQTKISILWLIILIGLVFHTILHLIPVFYGVDIVKPNSQGVIPLGISLTMGFTFLIPVAIICLCVFFTSKWARVINFIVSLIVALINIAHLSEFFLAKSVDIAQVFVLPALFVISLFLCVISYKWIKILTK